MDDSDSNATIPYRNETSGGETSGGETSGRETTGGNLSPPSMAEKSPIDKNSPKVSFPDQTKDVNKPSEIVIDQWVGKTFKGFQCTGRVLGKGGMGTVYEAIELELNRRVALKVLPDWAEVDAVQVTRFKNEAKAVAQLKHANIVPLYHIDSDRGTHFYAMGLIEGQNLAEIIRSINRSLVHRVEPTSTVVGRRGSSTWPTHGEKEPHVIPSTATSKYHRINAKEYAAARSSRRGHMGLFQDIAGLGADVAEGLAHAHERGIVHRDVKPSNIMIDGDGKPWLTDFGLAKIRDVPGGTRTGDRVGTIRYMSPEQASGRRYLVDHRTDIYSLGVTLYELITLQKPFHGESERELLRQVSFEEPLRIKSLIPSVPAELVTIIQKAISKNPHDRYETAAAFADDLRRYATGRPILARRASLGKIVWRWMERHRLIASAAGIVMLVTLLVTSVAYGLMAAAYREELVAHERTKAALKEVEGLRLITNATLQLVSDPGLSLILAVAGGELKEGLETQQALAAALNANHEIKSIARDRAESSIVVSPNGKTAVVCAALTAGKAEGSPTQVIDLVSGSARPLDEKLGISSAAFHPSGNRVLVACSTGFDLKSDNASHSSKPASLLSLESGNSSVLFADSSLAVASADCFSADGKTLVLPTTNDSAAIYDAVSGERLISFRGHAAQVMNAVMSRNGKTAASIDATGQIAIWETASAKLLKTVSTLENYSRLSSMAFTASGSHLLVSGVKGASTFSATDESVKPLAQWREPRFTVNPSFDRVACYWQHGNDVVVRDATTGDTLSEISQPQNISCVHYDKTGRNLIVAAGNECSIIDESFGTIDVQFKGHRQSITDFAVSDTPMFIVTASMDKSIRVWSTETELQRRCIDFSTWGDLPTRQNSASNGISLATSSDGEPRTMTFSLSQPEPIVAAAGKIHESDHRDRLVTFDQSSVRLIDAQTNRKLAETAIRNGAIEDAILCPGTSRVLLIYQDGRAAIWHSNNQRFHWLSGTNDPATARAVSSDGSRVALGSRSNKCRIIESATGASVAELTHHGPVTHVEFIAGNDRLITIENQRTVLYWEGLDQPATRSFSHPGAIFSTAKVSLARKIILAYRLNYPGKFCSWNWETGELLKCVDLASAVQSCAYDDSIPCLAIASRDAGAKLWDPHEEVMRDLSSDPAASVAFARDTLIVAQSGPQVRLQKRPTSTAKLDGSASLRFFDPRSGELRQTVSLPYEPKTLSVDPDSGRVALYAMGWPVAVLQPGRETIERSAPFSAPINVIQSVAKTGGWAVGCNDGRAAILDPNAKLIKELPSGRVPITCGSTSSDGQLFAAGTLDGNFRVWDIDDGKVVQSISADGTEIRYLQFDVSNNGILYATESMKLWHLDLRSGKKRSLDVPDGIQAVHLARSGKFALIVTGKGVWSSRNAQPPTTFNTNKVPGKALLVDLTTFTMLEIEKSKSAIAGAINEDSSKLALLNDAHSITIVDAKSLEPIRSFTNSSQAIAAVFLPDDRGLAVLSHDGIALWNYVSGEQTGKIDVKTRSTFNAWIDRNAWKPFIVDGNLVSLGANVRFHPLDLLKLASSVKPRELTPEEIVRFKVDQYVKAP